MGQLSVTTTVLTQPPSWKKSVHDYLHENNLECIKATPLQGGASAYIWKVEGLKTTERGRQSPEAAEELPDVCILKYGDTVAKNVALPLSSQRMGNEARAMNMATLNRVCSESEAVEIPRLVLSTKEAVIMTWAGETDLRSAYIQHPEMDAEYVGGELGRWTANMHVSGIDDPEGKQENWDTSMKRAVVDLEIASLRATAPDDTLTAEIIEKALAVYHDPVGVRTITPVDFRPMNTLLRGGDGTVRPGVAVVDWEITCYGDPAFDLRMWVAEAVVLEAQHGRERGLLRSFLTAYRQHAGERIVDLAFVSRIAVLVGSTWLMIMPCSLWECTDAEGESYKKLARSYVRAGVDQDRAWLRQSPLAPLLQ